jgi:hypothetical protein
VSGQLLPTIDVDSAPFWEGCRDHRLLAQQCGDCGTTQFPSAPICRNCRSRNLAWTDLPKVGSLYSWVVVHHGVTRQFRERAPYTVAIAEFLPGVRVPSQLVGSDPETLVANLPIRVEFVDTEEGVTLYQFVVA